MKKVLVPRVRFKGFDEEWKEDTIGNIANITNGKLDANAMVKSGMYNFYTSGIDVYKIDKYSFEGEGISIAGNGVNMGYMHLVSGKYNAYQRTYILNNIKIDRHFLFYNLWKNFWEFCQKNTREGSIPYLLYNDISDFKIFKSHSNEQQKISKLLDYISNLINLEEIKLNKLKQVKETLLQKMFPEGNSKIPRIRFKGFDEEWSEERLENITKRMSSGGTPSTTIKKFYNGKIPFLTISDMTKVGKYINNTEKNITPEAIENSSTWLVPKNSLLLSMYASFGKTAINKKEITTSQAILGIILNNNISVEFLYYLLFLMDINQYWYKQVETGTQPNLSNWTVSKTLIKLTKNISEQQKIGDFFSKIDNIINLYQSKLNKLKQIKEALLQKMFV
ncbi:restriction endonuclease subunit S [Mycoplasmopsis felis]|uniref:restriction endonuclease subunit S n=1 Tax=Mycoplasmopsis felis TaxID=33923 RepID=UPI002AFDCB85|nr:restriction endonuclease subunit S [Mycoplasmopsis felis]WQQ06383.1 restriction endonuclease subunit S [Mycoplasmopsis felis]